MFSRYGLYVWSAHISREHTEHAQTKEHFTFVYHFIHKGTYIVLSFCSHKYVTMVQGYKQGWDDIVFNQIFGVESNTKLLTQINKLLTILY